MFVEGAVLWILGECIEYFFFSVYVGCFTKFKFRGGEVKQGYVVMHGLYHYKH